MLRVFYFHEMLVEGGVGTAEKFTASECADKHQSRNGFNRLWRKGAIVNGEKNQSYIQNHPLLGGLYRPMFTTILVFVFQIFCFYFLKGLKMFITIDNM